MSRIERTESTGDSLCPVCHEESEIYSIGPCDHPICYRCSTRMRVLCNQMYCPICRGDLPQVVFLTEKKKYDDVNRRNCIPNRKFKILLEDETVEEAYEALLEHRCRVCEKGPLFDTFPHLQAHLRKTHTLFACDLCVGHLKIFSFERKFYNRKDLATHKRSGDSDNRSYRGHPLCQFCDERYFDNDELMRHLRKDHFYCHFCDAANSNEYYNDYEDLKHHFKNKHFLCEEGNCASVEARFTHAFGSEIDLKAHMAAEHLGNKSKAQAKEVRTLDISFQYTPRRRGRDASSISAEDYEDLNQAGRGQRRYRNREEPQLEARPVVDSQPSQQERSTSDSPRVPVLDDFPTLGGKTPPVVIALPQRKPTAVEEDFPALSLKKGPTVSASVTSASVVRGTSARQQSQVSASACQRQLTPFSTLTSSSATATAEASRPKVSQTCPAPMYVASQNTWAAPRLASGEDFPSLGGEKKSKSSVDGPNFVSLGVWSRKNKDDGANGQPSSAAPNSGKASALVTKPTSLAPRLASGEDFPLLGGEKKSKSSVDGPNFVSLGVWSRKNKDDGASGQPSSAAPNSSKASAPVTKPNSSKASAPMTKPNSSKASAPVTKPTSLAALGKSLCDDGEFPSLGSVRPVQPAGWVEKKTNSSNTAKNAIVGNVSSKNKNDLSLSRSRPDFYVVLNDSKDNKTEETCSKKKKQKEGKKTDSADKLSDSSSVPKQAVADEEVSLSVKLEVAEDKKDDTPVPDSWESSPILVDDSQVDVDSFQVVPSTKSKSKKSGGNEKKFWGEDFPTLTLKKATPEAPSKPEPSLAAPPVAVVVNSGEEKENKKQTGSSLNSKPFREEDFPVLQAVQKTAPPPGFQKPSKVSVPPGLKKPTSLSQSGPPPGLSSAASVISDSATSIPMSVKLNMYTFVPPFDSGERNRDLVMKVRKMLILKDDGFDQFRALSGEFQSGQLKAPEYYKSCKELFGEDKFVKVFPELVALLPDILKQHELAQAHRQDRCGETSPLMIATCPTCHQLLKMADYATHLPAHANLDTNAAAAAGIQASFPKELPPTGITT